MGLILVGTLPVSALNIGLVAGVSALEVKVTKLTADISLLDTAITGQAQFALNPPTLDGLEAGLTAHLGTLVALVDPGNFTINAKVGALPSLTGQIGIIDGYLQVVTKVAASFQAGLNAGSLAAWSYAGNSRGFGQTMLGTSNGWGDVSSGAEVNAIIIATESFESWGQFSLGFNTGTSSSTRVSSDAANLTFLGVLSAASLDTGVQALSKDINLFLGQLNGAKLVLEGNLPMVSVGANLPSVAVLKNAALKVDLSAAFKNMISGKLNLTGQIGGINAKIDAIVKLTTELGLQLSAGGLTVWLYSGLAAGLGPALAQATANGLPGASGPTAPAYGLVVATELPSVWANFSTIFGVAA